MLVIDKLSQFLLSIPTRGSVAELDPVRVQTPALPQGQRSDPVFIVSDFSQSNHVVFTYMYINGMYCI